LKHSKEDLQSKKKLIFCTIVSNACIFEEILYFHKKILTSFNSVSGLVQFGYLFKVCVEGERKKEREERERKKEREKERK